MREALAPESGASKSNDFFEKSFRPQKSEVYSGKLKREKSKKKKPKAVIVIIIIAVVLAVIGVGGFAAYHFGYLDPYLLKLGIIKSAAELSIDRRSADLDKRKSDLDARESSLNQREAQVKQKEADLTSKTAASLKPESFEEILSGLSSEKTDEIKKVALIYSNMDPAAASSIITKVYTTNEVAAIIYYMKPDASALLLAKLDTTLAASVTKLLLS